jgi:hypothetical protein
MTTVNPTDLLSSPSHSGLHTKTAYKDEPNVFTLGQVVDPTAGLPLLLVTPGVGTEALYVRTGAESGQRFVVSGAGALSWGDGTAAPDTNLYRSAANVLKTDDAFTIGGTILEFTNSNPSISFSAVGNAERNNVSLYSIVTGEANRQFQLRHSGKMDWGPGGATAMDTNLYRTAANQLKTDDNLQAVDGVATKYKAGTPVDGDFASTPPDGTLVVDSTGNKIWARVGGTWKGVVIA